MTQAVVARVRPAGRKAEPPAGPDQVPGQEAGLRGVQAAGAGRAQGAAARPALDRVPGRSARHRRAAAARQPGKLPTGAHPAGFDEWREHNVLPQRQDGLRGRHHHPAARRSDRRPGAGAGRHRPALHRRHAAHDRRPEHAAALGERAATCPPSTPTWWRRSWPCRGQAPSPTSPPARGPTPASWGSPRRARWRPSCAASWQAAGLDQNARARGLHIKTSGCFNACGQHHVADIGFLGVSRNVSGRRVPHFQLVIGGRVDPQRRRLRTGHRGHPLQAGARVHQDDHRDVRARPVRTGETFQAFVNRIGKKTIRAMVEELQVLPPYEQDPSYYSDWGDPREYTINDMGVGECAGEVVPYVEMGLAAAEREIFEAQLLLDDGKLAAAASRAYSAMLQAARALARERNPNLGTDPEEVVGEFRALLLRHPAVLRPLRRGQVRPVSSSGSTRTRPGPRPARPPTRSSRRRSCSSTPPTSATPAWAPRWARPRPPACRPDRPPGRRPWTPTSCSSRSSPNRSGDLSLETFIPVFHRWIKDRVLADDTLVDVANYAHVPQAPGWC